MQVYWTDQEKDSLCYWLQYEPETGVLSWKHPKRGLKRRTCDTLDTNGYIKVRVNGLIYLAHRVGWFLHHNAEAPLLIDHINGVKNDNRIRNLRLADHSINSLNSSSTTMWGVPGVYLTRSGKFATKFRGQHLGSYATAKEASVAYQTAKQTYLRKHTGELQ